MEGWSSGAGALRLLPLIRCQSCGCSSPDHHKEQHGWFQYNQGGDPQETFGKWPGPYTSNGVIKTTHIYMLPYIVLA